MGAQQAAIPIVGFLHAGSPEPNTKLVTAFRKGLTETGYVEARNVRIEYRWAADRDDRLADSSGEIEAAMTKLAESSGTALMVAPDALFTNLRAQIVAVAARYAMPAVYSVREFAEAGGLLSYGPNFVSTYEQVGDYAGRILKGEKPSELPVMQASKFELVGASLT